MPREVIRFASVSDVAPQPKRSNRSVVMRAGSARSVVHEHDAIRHVVPVRLTPAADVHASADAVDDKAGKESNRIRTRRRRGGDLSRKRARDRANRAQDGGEDD